jgi:hypothetical protein
MSLGSVVRVRTARWYARPSLKPPGKPVAVVVLRMRGDGIDPFGRFNRPKNRPRTAARLW